MNAQAVTTSGIFLQLYFMATAVFLVLDYSFGINVRLASLDAFPKFGVRFIMSSVSIA
jgi:hypothetical protein